MFENLIAFILSQLTEMGVCGFIVALMLVALYKVWQALQLERLRSENLVGKMYELSKETVVMIERISGR